MINPERWNFDSSRDHVFQGFEEEIDIFRSYLEDMGFSHYTYISYLEDLKLFFSFLHAKTSGSPNISDIGKREIQEFLRKAHRGKAKSTRNRRLMAIRTFFKSLVKADILDSNPALDVDTAKQEKNHLPIYLNDRELKALFESIPRDAHYLRNKAILMLMGLAGLRVIEIHNLNVTDLIRIPDNPGLRVFGKGNKTRYIPLPFELYDLLLQYEKFARPKPRSGDENAFFLSRLGKRISRRRIQEVAEEAFRNLKNLPEFSYLKDKTLSAHKLRHTFGTLKVQEGVDLVTIQELMGHSSLNTTQIYTHVKDEQKQKAMRSGNVAQFF